MSCRSCTPWDKRDDYEGCVDINGGEVYGCCTSDLCGGLCEYLGSCPCVCHILRDPERREAFTAGVLAMIEAAMCTHERIQPGGACDDCGDQVYAEDA